MKNMLILLTYTNVIFHLPEVGNRYVFNFTYFLLTFIFYCLSLLESVYGRRHN